VPRPARLHLPGGTYYALQIAAHQQWLFNAPEHYAAFESRLIRALNRTGTQLLAYCWLPRAVHLAVRSHDVPMSRFMQGVTGSYARYLHRGSSQGGHVFRQRFQSVLIDPQAWLPELVRFIHYTPVREMLVQLPEQHDHSSCRNYLGIHRSPWLDTQAMFAVLESRGYNHQARIDFLRKTPSSHELELFETNGHADFRIVGDVEFRAQLPHAHRVHRRLQTLELLIDRVIISQGVERAELFSGSRRHGVALARSLIAWHARELHLATLAEVARRLGRDSSTLSKAMTRHRALKPALFESDAFSHLVPLG
jgi:putative transposase